LAVSPISEFGDLNIKVFIIYTARAAAKRSLWLAKNSRENVERSGGTAPSILNLDKRVR
jgi:hypothetical protein